MAAGRGSDPADMSYFAGHDPDGPILHLPGGMTDPRRFQERHIVREVGIVAWFQVLAGTSSGRSPRFSPAG